MQLAALISVVAAGCFVATFALYLLVLSVAAGRYTRPIASAPPSTRLLVLVPAHNEAGLIARCVRSLLAQTYPSDLYSVAVIADNCSDDTAAIASHAGAAIALTRDEPNARGKGHALRWALDRLLSEDADAIVVVDADSVADPDFLARLVQPFEAGARAVQGESLLYEDGSVGTALRVAAFLLVNRVRPAGRAALHLPATHLAGNGMLVARDVLQSLPWRAFTSAEDLEYSLDLRKRGVRIAFAGGAVLMSPAAPNSPAAAVQELRWQGGQAYLARTRIPALVREAIYDRRPSLLALAFDLAVPPLGFLAAAAVGGVAIGACAAGSGLVPVWILTPWVLSVAAIAAFVLIGLNVAGAPKSVYRALVRAPAFIVGKSLRAYRILSFRSDTWVRTERASEPEVRSET